LEPRKISIICKDSDGIGGEWAVGMASAPSRAECMHLWFFWSIKCMKMLFQSGPLGDLMAVDENVQQRRDQPPQLHVEELGTKVFFGVDATQLGPPVDGCFERIVPWT